MKHKLLIVVIIISAVFLSNERSWSQYTDAQINFVINKLKEKNLLPTLIELTGADSRQSASRADVLMACYLIVRHFDENTDIAGLNLKLTQLQTSVKNLERAGGGRYPSEELLVQRILERVEKNLPQQPPSQATEASNKEIKELRATIEAMKRDLKDKQPNNLVKLEQKVQNNTVIASAAVVLSLIITIFAAR